MTLKMGAQAIVGCFQTTALDIAQSEASIGTFHQQQIGKWIGLWVKLNTLPERHPLRFSIKAVHQSFKLCSSLGLLADRFAGINMSQIETVTLFAKAPWLDRLCVIIEECNEATKATTIQDGDKVYCYTNSSSRNGILGTGMVYILLDKNQTSLEQYATTGLVANSNIYATELKAISTALSQLAVWTMILLEGKLTIFSDNQSALKSIRKRKHMRTIYNQLSKMEAQLLAHLQMSHC